MGTGYHRPSDEGPTIKQLRFIHDLGGDLVRAIQMHNWREASDYIEELKRNRPSGAPPVGVTVTTPVVMASSRQVDYIKSLGGDPNRAVRMTREDASRYIEELKNNKATTAAPQPTGQPVTDPRLDLLQGLLDGVKDGYYAVQLDESDPLTFIRVSRPKKGEFEGAVKVQTQHSDELKLALVRWPSSKWSKYRGDKIIDLLMVLVLDPVKFGLMYAKELNHCMKCNKPLTDERSRHYGIGPDCEKLWPTHVERVDDLMHNGHSYEYLKSRAML
jgi:hypothetical protein